MDKIALSGPAEMLARETAPDASQANLTSDEPTGSTLDGGIFDDFALIGALVFGIGDAELDHQP